MKALKSLCLLLLLATGAMAQPNPNDMFIDGYVVDQNGAAQAGQTVCVSYLSNNPSLPSDSICTTTNANGYYFLIVPNGSLTGPNVNFDVFTYDPCSFLPLSQQVANMQGTVDMATVTFTVCANSTGCSASFTTSVDSANGTAIFTFVASATGQAPFTYDWWVDGTSYSTESVTHVFNGGIVGVYLTVTDASGCEAIYGDTLYLDGNQIGCDVVVSFDQNPILGGGILTANASGVAPFTYLWDDSQAQTTQSIFPAEPYSGTYCVTITDATGCQSIACYTFPPNQGCSVDIITTVDSTGGGLVYTLATTGFWNTYSWSTGEITQSITVQNPGPNGEVICVTATDQAGCNATTCDTLLPINSGNCFADFWYQTSNPNASVAAGEAVQFNYSGSQAPFNYYFWTVQGMGMVMNSYEENPVFTFPTPGSYEICIEVYDSIADCADTYCEFVQVASGNGGGCEANFTWYEDSLLGSPLPAIAFSDLSQGAASWFWDFGDNTFSTAQNPLHTYNSTGLYLVCLTIVSADQSCQQTFCDSVYIGNYGGGCNAAFSTSGPTPNGYSFVAQVQDPELYYGWSVDNQFVTGGAGDFQLALLGLSNGVHTICLTVIDSLTLCSDQQCQTITVGANNCYGYISGQLYAGSNNQPLDEGVVYLITYDANTNQLTAVDSMVVDSGNYYFFGPLTCGDYLIKAAAYPGSQYYNSYIPTYFGNSPFWGFAQTITLAQVNTQVTADVFLIGASNPGGPGFIGGNVTQGANKMDEGDPVANMLVMLFDEVGNAIGYVYTDANGAFGFSDLAYGSYQVYVEQLGVHTEAAFVTIGPENPTVEDLQIISSETLITTGINEFDIEGAISDVYPNPVLDQVTVTFNLEHQVMMDVSVLDLAGRTISNQTVSVSEGESTLRFGADGLKGGYYFLRIQEEEGAFSVTRKFLRVD